MLRRRRKSPATPPADLRVRYPDGSHLALEVRWVGTDADGIDHWQPTQMVQLPEGATITCGLIPPRTAIDLFVDVRR